MNAETRRIALEQAVIFGKAEALSTDGVVATAEKFYKFLEGSS